MWRGFVTLNMLIDADTHEVQALIVTDDRTGGAPVLEDLIGQVIKEPVAPLPGKRRNELAQGVSPLAGITGKKQETLRVSLYADGGYASRKNIEMCRDRGIEPLIKVAVNSGTRGKGAGDAFGMAVREQLGGGPEEPV